MASGFNPLQNFLPPQNINGGAGQKKQQTQSAPSSSVVKSNNPLQDLLPPQNINAGHDWNIQQEPWAPNPNDPSGGVFQEYAGDPDKKNNEFWTTNRPIVPSQPTAMNAALKKQVGRTDYLNKNFNKLSDEQYNPYANVERGNLRGAQKRTKESFAGRGLLNSGLSSSAQMGNRAESQGRLRDARQKINSGLLGDVNKSRDASFDLASVMAQNGINTDSMTLDALAQQIALASENNAMAVQAYGNIGSGAASVFGKYLGSK